MRAVYAAIALGLALLPASEASSATLIVKGRVSYIAALQNGQTVATPSTNNVAIGDTFTLRAQFDFNAAVLTALYDADPSVNIYYLPGTTVSARIGSYASTFKPLYDFNASVQLWNDRDVVGPVDAQSIEFFNYDLPSIQKPFDVGSGMVSELFGASFFDFTANARKSDLLSEWAPLPSFGSRSFSYGLLNSDTNLFVSVQADVTSATFLSVPEPATWTLMIAGFAAAGFARRRVSEQRQSAVTLA